VLSVDVPCVCIVYYAVGLASFDMYDLIDFDSWLTNTLIGELQITHSKYVSFLLRCFWLGKSGYLDFINNI
jgi:hypothetical protein